MKGNCIYILKKGVFALQKMATQRQGLIRRVQVCGGSAVPFSVDSQPKIGIKEVFPVHVKRVCVNRPSPKALTNKQPVDISPQPSHEQTRTCSHE